MHLRLGKSIASGTSKGSKISTEESWSQARQRLGPIAKESSSISLSTNTNFASGSSKAMGDSSSRGKQGVSPGPVQGGNNVGHNWATRLDQFGQNMHGTHLYTDPSYRIAMKMEDILSPLESKVWVTFQGDRYMSLGGIEYVLSSSFECMDRYGKVHPRRPDQGARTKPTRGHPSGQQGS